MTIPLIWKCSLKRFASSSARCFAFYSSHPQSARLRDKSENMESGGDVSSDEDEDEDISEELGYISPLDNVNPYASFKHALTSACFHEATAQSLLLMASISNQRSKCKTQRLIRPQPLRLALNSRLCSWRLCGYLRHLSGMVLTES